VLPLLQEEHEAAGSTTVEERIIGAGLKSLKGEDAPAITALFEMFAVTQEDFVHPMAVIELLWRSCCCKGGGDIGLSARLKVRQWTQLLIDQSLLLGSSSKGVHVHDIVLTHLRKRQDATERRAMQKRVVEGLVQASRERISATGRGFQDTGSTAKAFDGEEVDWYVCNVASYHVKQSMDPSSTLVENKDLKCWLLLDDEAIVRAAAVVAGMLDLESLVAHYSTMQKWFEAAKVKQAVGMVSAEAADHIKHMKAALGLLEKAGSATAVAQQLELDVRGNLNFHMSTGPDKKRNTARMQELTTNNSSLRVDPLSVYLSSVVPRCWALCGMHPAYWDAGKVATQDTAEEGLLLHIREGGTFITKAVSTSSFLKRNGEKMARS
jgi:hypothetical protein